MDTEDDTERRTRSELDDWERRAQEKDAQRARWIAQNTCQHCGQHPEVPENLR